VLTRPARAQTRVTIGYLPLLGLGPLFVAYERGYLRDVGLDAELVPFTSGAEMIVALGTGELAVGIGGIAAGLFNAWTRDVRIALVADNSQAQPGYGFIAVVVRSDLAAVIQSGADLRGRQVNIGIRGALMEYVIHTLLEQSGLTSDDVELVRLQYPDLNAGLAGRRVDVAGVPEPYGALAEQSGLARKWLTADQIVPGVQVGAVMLSEQAARDRARITAFITAYLRGVRDFVPNQTSDAGVIEVVSRWTGVSADLMRRVAPTYIDPNGTLNVTDLDRQQAFWLRQGVVTAAAPAGEHIDMSFAEAALQQLGRVVT
jgi:NitT/TauT family transport system substrate-binding protein